MQALQIIVLDDNDNMQKIVRTILNAAGAVNIRNLADGQKALDSIQRQPADIIIADFNMRPMDGITFARRIRDTSQCITPFVPIIMMTGHSEWSRVTEARDAGVNEFLAKPITPRSLLDRVQAVIERPRPFIRTETYFGPDRRRKVTLDYDGPFRRITDANAPLNL